MLNGPSKVKKVAFRVFGDLSRDFNAETSKNILSYHQMFFQVANSCVESKDETMTLNVLRVFWNSSFNNTVMQ
jgi:hypothetical protein